MSKHDDTPRPLAPLALDLERMAKSLLEQAQRYSVLCANADRKQSADAMLGASSRCGELISSIHSLQIAARRIEHTSRWNHRILKDD